MNTNMLAIWKTIKLDSYFRHEIKLQMDQKVKKIKVVEGNKMCIMWSKSWEDLSKHEIKTISFSSLSTKISRTITNLKAMDTPWNLD